jgi:hypothetical protein
VRDIWKNRVLLAGALALTAFLGAAVLAAPAPASGGTWAVHEWGTFLSVQGSDGVTLGGMVDSEEALPHFVRQRDLGGRSRASFFSKMETPVTYFYTDRPRDVQVRVDMPGGLLTHWFPDIRATTPRLPPTPKDLEIARREKLSPAVTGSSLDWGTFQVFPDTRFLPMARQADERQVPRVPYVGSDTTWRFARATDSALVRSRVGGQELVEKFLFYRGLGTFDLPLEARSSGPDTQLHLLLHNRGSQPLTGLFAVWVQAGYTRFAALGDLAGGETEDVDTATAFTAWLPLEDGVAHARHEVAEALVRAGLYPKEAQAMVNTWEHSYFRTDGLRLLAVLPRPLVDATIPIHIKPEPRELVRVMVGRVEVLTPNTERQLEKALAELGAQDTQKRQAAEAALAKFGRLREPVVRRILALSHDPEVRARAQAQIGQTAVKK